MTIRCLAFDLDDTFWDCTAVIQHAEQQFYAWLMANYPQLPARYSQAALVEKRVEYVQRYPHLQYNLTNLRKNWLATLAEECGCDATFVEQGFDVFWRARNQVNFFEGTLEVLHRLQAHFVMGVVSNGNACVHHIGIGHLFQFAVNAEQVGVTKPHPAIFQYALAKVGMTPQQAVYVGDDPVKDVQGAARAGWRTVWFNPQQLAWPATLDVKPDAEIQHWYELEPALATL